VCVCVCVCVRLQQRAQALLSSKIYGSVNRCARQLEIATPGEVHTMLCCVL
jgi:hypothetical protein